MEIVDAEVYACPLCVQQLSQKPLFVPGVWGPCLSAMVPELWLNEGGQSATGRLVRLPVGWDSAHGVCSLQLRRICQRFFPLCKFKKNPALSVMLLGSEQRGQHKDLLYCVKEMGLVPEPFPCLSSNARNNAADSHHKPRPMNNMKHYAAAKSISAWCCLCFSHLYAIMLHFLLLSFS